MSDGAILALPNLRGILQEKENIQKTSVILHTKEYNLEYESSDDGSMRTDKSARRRRRPKKKAGEPIFDQMAHAEEIARRNERERNRVRMLNESYEELRDCIPDDFYKQLDESGKKQKLSKLEVLRLAVEYIQRLEGVLVGENTDNFLVNSDIKSEADDNLTLNSDNYSRDADFSDDKSVDQFCDETSLPSISQSFPGKRLSTHYPDPFVPFGVTQLKT